VENSLAVGVGRQSRIFRNWSVVATLIARRPGTRGVLMSWKGVGVQVALGDDHGVHGLDDDLGLADPVGRPACLLERGEVVAGHGAVGLGQPDLAQERHDVQPQGVCVDVLGVALDPVVAQEDRLVLLDRPRRPGNRVQPAGCPADEGGVLFGRFGDRDRPLLGVVGARGLVPAVRVLVEAPVAVAFRTLAMLDVSHVCLQFWGEFWVDR
jgi:hypothetical protein